MPKVSDVIAQVDVDGQEVVVRLTKGQINQAVDSLGCILDHIPEWPTYFSSDELSDFESSFSRLDNGLSLDCEHAQTVIRQLATLMQLVAREIDCRNSLPDLEETISILANYLEECN